MKVFRLILLLSALTIVGCTDMALTTNTEDTNSRQLESRNVRTPFFEFPVIQWEILETHEQKLAACEIPDSILSKIPTKDLVEICMKYPLLLDAYAFNTPLQGIKTVISRFNGFKELMNRKDNCIYIFDFKVLR